MGPTARLAEVYGPVAVFGLDTLRLGAAETGVHEAAGGVGPRSMMAARTYTVAAGR
ncbi:hypothetical protein ACFYWX_39985 [Streptomyces sp. NPDC002888]|uniref:hypothetical protein n=1 Tax=Streptomyces sp. NPDC002888 TaxID=3364668 RepID=UPI0036D1790D